MLLSQSSLLSRLLSLPLPSPLFLLQLVLHLRLLLLLLSCFYYSRYSCCPCCPRFLLFPPLSLFSLPLKYSLIPLSLLLSLFLLSLLLALFSLSSTPSLSYRRHMGLLSLIARPYTALWALARSLKMSGTLGDVVGRFLLPLTPTLLLLFFMATLPSTV